SNVKFESCVMANAIVSPQTKISGAGLHLRGGVLGLQFRMPNSSIKQFYALHDVASILEKIGIKFTERIPKERALSDKSRRLIDQLSSFLRVPEKTLYFS